MNKKEKYMSIEDYLNSLDLKSLSELACGLSKAEPCDEYLNSFEDEATDKKKKIMALNEWLKFIQSDSSTAKFKWAYFKKRAKQESGEKDKILGNRDKYVFQYFMKLSKHDGEIKFQEYIENNWGPWSYYQDHFFNWFLNRYHIRYARRIFSNNFFVKYFHVLFFIMIPTLLSFYYLFLRSFVGALPLTIIGIPIISLVLGGLVWKNSKLKLGDFVHSQVPRLAATIAIGYFFLLSAPNFVRDIFVNRISFFYQIGGAVVLLVSSLVFIMLNIQKRVKPELDFIDLVVRSLEMMIIALTYGIYELLIFERILFLSAQGEVPMHVLYPCFPQLFFILSIALSIGIVFQLVWEERPFTEPL